MQPSFSDILEGYRATYPLTLTTDQVAEMLGTRRHEVSEMARTGRIPAYRWGRRWRFIRDEVLAWMLDQRAAGV
jgi:excisionase family DNA binding protein